MESRIKTILLAGGVVAIAGVAYMNGWKLPDAKVTHGRLLQATIGTFDPNADIKNLDDYGTTWPNEYEVQQAFNRQIGIVDLCVEEEEARRGGSLQGTAKIAVKLNPNNPEPFGVNADIPKQLGKRTELVDCLRAAVAKVKYPVYDGPPLIVNFQVDLEGVPEVPD